MPCRKNVSFDRRIKIRSVPSLGDFSKEEQNAAWFSSYDLNEIQSRERRLKGDEASLQDALRTEIGLESSIERRIRRARVDLGKYSVLLEQQRQWQEEDAECPETLARATSMTSEESAMIALQKAMSVAQQVHDETEERTLRTTPTNRLPRLQSRGQRMYRSDPFSKSSSSNQKWSVTGLDTGLSIPRRPKHKYDLQKLGGLVGA
mmetsp:Transcript_21783/g.33285  ORF Transcript_21783/g.33285 Transcript_21783/m.33285 type:complete len:205 (+) Transcript_21783:79-693(+)